MSSRLLLLLLALVLTPAAALAQGTIRGTVTDAVTEEPLPGASVVLLDTQFGAATGPNGQYTISSIPAGEYLIQASFVGYDESSETVTVRDGQTLTLDFDLALSTLEIGEIAVTALGFAEDRDTRGSTSENVSGDEITRSGEVSVLRGLSAKAAGVDVSASGGDPGSSTRIVIRGQSTISGNNQPLIIIDGVPIENSSIASGGPAGGTTQGVQEQSRLNDLNPEDIESVEVLKSASAAALWGSRAQGGVIVITTKQGTAGSAGRPNVSYRSTLSIDDVNELPDLQEEYGQGNGGLYQFIPSGGRSWGDRIAGRSGGEDDVIDDPSAPGYLGAAVGVQTGNVYYAIPGGTLDDPHGGKNSREVFSTTDALLENGLYWDNNVSVSGGDINGRYYLSLANLTQDGIVIENSNFDRTSVRLNAERFLSSKVSVQGIANYIRTVSDRVQQGSNLSGLFLGGLRTPADFNVADYRVNFYAEGLDGAFQPDLHRAYRNPLGFFAPYGPALGDPRATIYDNPLFSIYENTNESRVNRFQGKVALSYDPLNWLNITARTGADYYADRRQIFFPVLNATLFNGIETEEEISEFQINGDLLARATRELTDDIGGSVLVGLNINHREFDFLGADLINFSNPVEIRNLGNAENANVTAGTNQSVRRTFGVFGELDTDLYDQLYLKLTGRFDNASTFGPDAEDTFFYPSASLAWQFGNLLQDNQDILSFGKLRASYGEVGREPDPYLAFTYFFPAAVGDGYTGFDTLEGAAYGGAFGRSARLASAGIIPERKREFEVGSDLRFLEDRLSLSGTYYFNRTTDAIFNVDVAPSTGFTVTTANAAEIENTGVEFTLDAKWPEVGDFAWNTYASWWTNENTVTDLAGVTEFSLNGFTSLTSSLVEGEPFGVLFGNRWRRAPDGCDPDDEAAIVNCEPLLPEEIEAGFSVASTGRVLDPDGFPIQAATQGIVGDPNPDWRASIGNTLRYKGASVNVLFDFKAGGDVWNGTKGALFFFGRSGDQDWFTTVSADEAATLTNYFGCTLVQLEEGSCLGGNGTVVVNDDGSYSFRGFVDDFGAGPVIVDEYYFRLGPGSGFTGPSEQFIEDGSYVRLREVTLSYNWADRYVQRLGLQSIDLALTGRNLWLSSDYSGVDPETNLTGPSNGQGLDYFNNPATRSYQFSLRFNY